MSLRDPDGNSITDPCQVATKFQQFYGNLYKTQSTYMQGDIQNYLHTLQFPGLNPEKVKLLDAPITTHDIAEAIAQLAKSKAPGLDGLPLEFYITYSDILIPKLKALYQSIFDLDSLPISMQEAQIKVLPKPVRTLTTLNPTGLFHYCRYRMQDIKILAKILASRLNTAILTLIYPDQTGLFGHEY